MSKAMLVLILGCGLFSACDAADRSSESEWSGTIDTLSNGALLVSNPPVEPEGRVEDWTLTESLRIGDVDGGGPTVFGRIMALAVDSRRRIHVLDHQAKEVRVFDRNGAHIHTIGRAGSGPGEFKNPFGLAIGRDDMLWVFDPGNGRYSVFDSAGAFHNSYRRPLGFFTIPWLGGLDLNGDLYDVGGAGEGEAVPILVRVDTSGVASDTVRLPYRDGEVIMVRRQGTPIMGISDPFSPALVWRFDPRGYIWHAFTEEYAVAQMDLNGDTARIVRLSADPVTITPAEADSALAAIQEAIGRAGSDAAPDRRPRVPEAKPMIRSIFVDEVGNLWVLPSVAAGSQARADVFNANGRYVASLALDFPMPSSPLPVFSDGALYAVLQDSLGVQEVVRYEVQR